MSAAASLDMAFARGALSAWSDCWKLDEAVVYDRLFEGARHAVINLDSALCPRDRSLVRPLLDLLTGLKLGEAEPVATTVLEPGMHGAFTARAWGRANPEELEVIVVAVPRLQALARPLGPTDLGVVRLIELTADCEV